MFLYKLLTEPLFFIRFIAIVIVSIVVHELAHGFAALSQGDDTPRRSGHLTLNPLVHLGWESVVFLCVAGIAWGQMPVNPAKFRSTPSSTILVAAAGPLANLALSLFSVVMMPLLAESMLGDILSIRFFHLAAYVNMVLFLLNCLPFPPLDGFQVLSGILPELKVLDNPAIGLFCLMILFLSPGFSPGIELVANILIDALTEYIQAIVR